MHFGQVKNSVKIAIAACFAATVLFVSSCREVAPVVGVGFKYPEQGQSYSLGKDVKVELDVPKGASVTAATYQIDGRTVETKADASPLSLKTTGLAVGYRVITAIVDVDGRKDTSTINIVLNSGVKPEQLTYKVVKILPHDTSSYTQGLEYHDGKFLESTGLNAESTLRWVALESGKATQRIDIDDQYFAEGSTLVGDKIIMLTWKANMGFVYDAKTLKQLSTFNYQTSRDGWGLCYDGKQLIMSDGSNRLYFMNKDTFKDERVIDVYDDKGAVDSINEMEVIDGKIYANLYQKNTIVVIDPNTGIVEKSIDMTGLLAKGYNRFPLDANIDVLNGIAWDKQGRRLFVTGKKWPKLFEITLVPQKGN